MKELTLENVQVDCRELTEEQVKEMVNVFEKNGFIIGNLAIFGKYYFLSHFRYRCCTTNIHDEKKTTITYEKFMELFGDQIPNVGKMVKTFKVKEYSTGDFMDLGREVGTIKAINKDKAWELYKETHRLKDNEKGFYSFVEIKDINQELNPVIEKPKEFQNLVESNNEELAEEAYKETKPQHYSKGIDTFNPQPHYNNKNGSLYKIANDLGLNHWEFDIFKRLVRCRKKKQFKEDLQKIKDTIDIYLNEYSE